MKTGRFSLLAEAGKLLGFALAIVLTFVGGVYWGSKTFFRGEDPTEEAPKISEKQSRFGVADAEPEDFFPVAEFRQQAGLLIGCYDQLNTDPQLYVDIASAIGGRLPVFGLVSSEDQARQGMELMRKSGLPDNAMYFLPMPANTIWIRDYGPFMVRRYDNSIVMVDAKYQSREDRELRMRDEEMAGHLSDYLGLPLRSIPLVLEGGNLLSNGDGAVVTSSLTFFENQSFDLNERQVGQMFNEFLGVRRWTWVVPLEGEPTGHVDMFVAFLAKNIVVVNEIPAEVDPVNNRRLDEIAQSLSEMATSLGPMKVFRLPMPPNRGDGWRSYTNIILANGVLLMPSFSDVDPAIENQAEEIYRRLLPGWHVKRIKCDSLMLEEGQLHCISYHIPRYVSLDRLYELSTARHSKRTPAEKVSPQVTLEKSAEGTKVQLVHRKS